MAKQPADKAKGDTKITDLETAPATPAPAGHMDLWDQVSKTNPAHTKKGPPIGGGKTLTAIDPMQQIKRATEIFGPVGTGWGWDVDLTVTDDSYVAVIRMWIGHNANSFGHIGQCLRQQTPTSKMDNDAAKKAVTDGVTKCLSLLGFNADVFLGRFDDNKYVAELVKEFAKDEPPAKLPPMAKETEVAFDDYCETYKTADAEVFRSRYEGVKAFMGSLDEGRQKILADIINKRKAEIVAMTSGDTNGERH